uniref:Uracil-DNA glycosylase n=1 Tax=Acrobeloides nanus TaxID=290746 RepID=A0A914D8X9_9BILA
ISTLKEPGWKSALMDEFQKPYMQNVFKVLEAEEKKGVKVFPPRDLIFNAFNLTPFNEVKVVLLGQDPYHNDRQAHGLCFSVQQGVPPPRSLINIYNELKNDYPDFNIPNHGSLEEWAKQGIFMLNATLTVEAHKANSHSGIGWQKFTDAVIKILNTQRDGIVFLLWGGFAHKKEALVDKKKHAIIKNAHPSPLSYRHFKGCKCFSKVNELLIEFKKEPINWSLS